MLDGSYSVPDIHNYIEYIKTKHETSSINPPIHIYINRISNRLVFKKKKDAYKLELETTETMKLLGSTKKSTNKTKSGENVPSLEVVGIALALCILVDHQYYKCSRYYILLRPMNIILIC